jgi:hypothetical protein
MQVGGSGETTGRFMADPETFMENIQEDPGKVQNYLRKFKEI